MRGGAAGSLCGHRAGERLAEASGAEEEGGRRPQTGRAGAVGGGGRSASQRQALFTTSRRSPPARGSRRPATPEATFHPLRPCPRGIITSQSPLRTSASGSSTFTEGRPTAGEKPQLPLQHGRVNTALYLYRRGLACLMLNWSIAPDRVLSTCQWTPRAKPHNGQVLLAMPLPLNTSVPHKG